MKKNFFKILTLMIVLVCGLNSQAQDYFAFNNVDIKGDTIKIVRNGDTTIIVNGNMKTFNFDTTIVFGNDTTFFKAMVIDSLLHKKYFDRWWDEDEDFFDNDLDKLVEDLGRLKKRFEVMEYKSKNTSTKKKRRRFWNYEFDFTFGYGPLSWSSMNSSDDLFSSPEGDYGLKFWSGQRWMLGFYTTFFPDAWVSLHSGIVYQSDVFKFRNNVFWDGENSERIMSSAISNNSKIVTRYVSIPLIASINIGKAWKSNFGLDVGAIGGLNFRTSHTGFKTNYNQSGKYIEESWGTRYKNFNKFKLDAHVGLHWGSFQIYCEQALIPIFKDNTEKELYPFSFGLMIGL
ncbi:MAG: hypothetical protein Q4Q06_00690 [Bacteroidota bacterium]|nr:hypothetical protein [Bacteroidota bacterium]